MSKFKVGDRVKVLSSKYENIEGETAVIEHEIQCCDDDYMFAIRKEKNKGVSWELFGETDLELIPEPSIPLSEIQHLIEKISTDIKEFKTQAMLMDVWNAIYKERINFISCLRELIEKYKSIK